MENKIFISMAPEELQNLITESVTAALSKLTPQQNQNRKEEPNYISKKDACKILKIGLTKLNELIKEGTIPAYRVGGSVRLLDAEVCNVVTGIKTQKNG
jgi:excisionase family DNA binding protein